MCSPSALFSPSAVWNCAKYLYGSRDIHLWIWWFQEVLFTPMRYELFLWHDSIQWWIWAPRPSGGNWDLTVLKKIKKLIIEGYMRCMGKLDYIMTSSFNISVCQFGGIDCHISIFKLDHWHIYMPSKPYQNNFLNIFILWHHKTQYSACPNASSFKNINTQNEFHGSLKVVIHWWKLKKYYILCNWFSHFP